MNFDQKFNNITPVIVSDYLLFHELINFLCSSDHIYPYGFHAFKLKACNRRGACSEATTQFTVSQGVTQCQLNIPPYYEYELVSLSIQ